MEKRILYYGSKALVTATEVRISRFNKDFFTVQKLGKKHNMVEQKHREKHT